MAASCTDEDDYPYPLPQEAIDWIKYYCTSIYVYHTPSFSLPTAVIEALSKVKKCGKTKVYRGMSFSRHNIDKGMELVDSIKEDTNQLTISTSLPISTSKDIEIAETFSYGGTVRILLELEVDEEDILVDLTLLDNNVWVWSKKNGLVYSKEEKEVILREGTYNFTVVSNTFG